MPSFTFPGVPPERLFEQRRRARPGGRGRRLRPRHGHGPLLPDPGRRPGDRPDARGLLDLAGLAARTKTVRLGHAGHRRHLPQPGDPGQDRHDARRHLRRPGDPRASGRPGTRTSIAGYGVDFPPIGERMDRLDEALTIARAMFTAGSPDLRAAATTASTQALNSPRPIQPGGPPILVGGGGEQRTLQIAAQHADMTHWFPLGLEVLRHKTEVLERHCEAIGRDPATIQRTMATPVLLAADEREAQRGARRRLPPERRAHVHARRRRSRRPRACGRTSTRASPASRSTTPSCPPRVDRPGRRAPAPRELMRPVPLPRGLPCDRRRRGTRRRRPAGRGDGHRRARHPGPPDRAARRRSRSWPPSRRPRSACGSARSC